jgi:hypothetical protein
VDIFEVFKLKSVSRSALVGLEVNSKTEGRLRGETFFFSLRRTVGGPAIDLCYAKGHWEAGGD